MTSRVQRVPSSESPPSALVSGSYSPAVTAALSFSLLANEDSDGSPSPALVVAGAPSQQQQQSAPQLSPQEMVRVRLRKTEAGFGFTLADGKDGRQRVRQLLDVANAQVAQLRVRDQLVAIEDILVHHLRHEQVRAHSPFLPFSSPLLFSHREWLSTLCLCHKLFDFTLQLLAKCWLRWRHLVHTASDAFDLRTSNRINWVYVYSAAFVPTLYDAKFELYFSYYQSSCIDFPRDRSYSTSKLCFYVVIQHLIQLIETFKSIVYIVIDESYT